MNSKAVGKYCFNQTTLSGVYEIQTFQSGDRRGRFYKPFTVDIYKEGNIDFHAKEVFFAESTVGVLRGIHFQLDKQQSKIVQCIKGHVLDVIVDLNPTSPTYMKWQSFDLTGNNGKAVYVPKFCGHSYYVIEDSIVCYICDETFYPAGDSGIIWNDADLGIAWPFDKNPILSDRDSGLMTFREYDKLIKSQQVVPLKNDRY